MRAIVPVRWRERARASRLGTYPRSEMALSTRRRVSGLTRSLSLITRETVIGETPERRATSLIVALVGAVFLGIGTTGSGRSQPPTSQMGLTPPSIPCYRYHRSRT